jgi:hypothetical protein
MIQKYKFDMDHFSSLIILYFLTILLYLFIESFLSYREYFMRYIMSEIASHSLLIYNEQHSAWPKSKIKLFLFLFSKLKNKNKCTTHTHKKKNNKTQTTHLSIFSKMLTALGRLVCCISSSVTNGRAYGLGFLFFLMAERRVRTAASAWSQLPMCVGNAAAARQIDARAAGGCEHQEVDVLYYILYYNTAAKQQSTTHTHSERTHSPVFDDSG